VATVDYRYLEGTFAPSQDTHVLSWERIRSASISNLLSQSDPKSGGKIDSAPLSSERIGALTATLGEKSLFRYNMEHPKTIQEEASQVERSQHNALQNISVQSRAPPSQTPTIEHP
jgi:hypothetical protein